MTNAGGNESSSTLLVLDFVPRKPFGGFDAGTYSTFIFVDLDGDGNNDLVSGEQSGTFKFYMNISRQFAHGE